MKAAWKYIIGTAYHGDNITEIEIPKNAKFLALGQQLTDICAWYEVDTDNTDDVEKVTWYQIGTGHSYDSNYVNLEYKGTVINNEAGLVWHMYKEVKA